MEAGKMNDRMLGAGTLLPWSQTSDAGFVEVLERVEGTQVLSKYPDRKV